MPLHLHFLPSLERSLKKLSPEQKEIVKLLLKALTIYLDKNFDIYEAQKIAPRFFFKQLRKPFYESSVEGKLHIVLRKDGSDCFALLVGNHDQVRRFLADQ